jgi:hypothetical protein
MVGCRVGRRYNKLPPLIDIIAPFRTAGHMARDCFQRNGPPGNQFGGPPGIGGAPGAPKSAFDSEYANLMAELGEGGAVSSSGPAVGMITNGAAADGAPAAPKVPPWRVPENWFSNSEFRIASCGHRTSTVC